MLRFSRTEIYFIGSRAEECAVVLCEIHGIGVGQRKYAPFPDGIRRARPLHMVRVKSESFIILT